MKKIMFLLILVLSIDAIFAQTPAIIMTTAKDTGSIFSFSLRTDSYPASIQVDFGDGVLVNKMMENYWVDISDTLVKSQTVKIYGEGITHLNCAQQGLTSLQVSNDNALTYLDCNNNGIDSLNVTENSALIALIFWGNQLTSIDVRNNTLLTIFSCTNNHVEKLDLSANTALTYIDAGNNNLSELNLSKNKKLTSLNCNWNHIIAIDISENTALTYFYCNFNQIKELDVSKNVLLTDIGCDNNQITSLDLRSNTSLVGLYCYNNQIDSLDLSKNTLLGDLFCESNKLTFLDLSNNIWLWRLFCTSNEIRKLNLADHFNLSELRCSSNKLEELSLTNDTNLIAVDCQYNRLSYASLPIRQIKWNTYYYSPQAPVSIARSVDVGVELDLSNQLSVNGNITSYRWKTQTGNVLAEQTDYIISDGKTTFKRPQPDSVYCEMSNDSLPDFAGINVLKTSNTKVILNTSSGQILAEMPKIYSYYKTVYIMIPFCAQLSIFDLKGGMVVQKPVSKGFNMIHIQNKGIYLVRLNSNAGLSVQKVFIE